MAENGDVRTWCQVCNEFCDFSFYKPTSITGEVLDIKLKCSICGTYSEMGAVVNGLKIFDPRQNKRVVSDNPALVMADMAKRGILKTNWKFDFFFWEKIGRLANFCD